jgi:uncharacterized protein (TIGR03067 family)
MAHRETISAPGWILLRNRLPYSGGVTLSDKGMRQEDQIMRRLSSLAMLVAVLALALGCGKKDSTESSGGGGGGGGGGSSSIEGTYVMVGMEAGGKDLSDFLKEGKEEEKTVKITGDKMIATKDGKEDPATYKLDNSKDPKTIDLTAQKTVSQGPSKGPKGKDKDKEKTVEEKMFGIYKVEGDKLIICLTEGKAEDRPKEFKTTEGGKAMMMTLQKKK